MKAEWVPVRPFGTCGNFRGNVRWKLGVVKCSVEVFNLLRVSRKKKTIGSMGLVYLHACIMYPIKINQM